MIDLGRIRRWASNVEGDHVAMSKAQFDELLLEAEAGRQARLELASHRAFGDFAERIAQ